MALCTQLGGTEGLVQLWLKAIEMDMAEGGFKAYRHITSILRMLEHCEDTRPDKTDYSQISDEELESALSNLVGNLFAQKAS